MGSKGKVVYKYQIGNLGRIPQHGQLLLMHGGAKPIRVGYQSTGYASGLMLWAMVDPRQPNAKYKIWRYPTGKIIATGDAEYVGSVETGAMEVWHIFITREEE